MRIPVNEYIHEDKRRFNARNAGQALVPVLFVVMILVALAVTLASVAKREIRAGSNAMKDTQAQYIALGAIRYAAAELEESTNGGATTPSLSVPPDTDANGWTQLGEGWYKLEIIDASSRLNINTATIKSLTQLPPCINDPTIAASIIDWRDSDSTSTQVTTGYGAESDYYQSLTPPYYAKNAAFDTVNELLMVKGITPEILYGSGTGAEGTTDLSGSSLYGSGVNDVDLSANGNSRAAQSRQSSGSSSGSSSSSTAVIDTSQSAIPLCELVTTFSKEQNVSSDGTARLNILTATASTMVTQLGITRQLAQRIVDARGQTGTSITSIADLMNISGITRTVLQSIGDKITTSTAKERTGVININTAPAEVLATIPGVDQTIYNAVIQARQSGTVFSGMNDIFQLTSLNRQQLQKLVDAVCTKSSVYIVRVKVRMPGSSKVYAAQAMVELLPATSTSTSSTSSSTSSTSSSLSSSTSTDTTTLPAPNIWQFHEVARKPGWSSWIQQGKVNP